MLRASGGALRPPPGGIGPGVVCAGRCSELPLTVQVRPVSGVVNFVRGSSNGRGWRSGGTPGSWLPLSVRPSSAFLQDWSPGLCARISHVGNGRKRGRGLGDFVQSRARLRDFRGDGVFFHAPDLESLGCFGLAGSGGGKARRRGRHIEAAQSSRQTSEDAGTSGSAGEDFVTTVLKDRPSQVERKYLIGGKYYTLKEKQLLQAPPWKKLAWAVEGQVGALRDAFLGVEEGRVEEEEEEKAAEEGERIDEAGTSQRAVKPIYISDLLREYKGNLYVPEEAFKSQVPGLDRFNRMLARLPEMCFEDFQTAVKANQVKMLTSRGIATPQGKYLNWDFMVELKEIPGEKSLQKRKWAMHLNDEDAKMLLSEYSGPQCEVETPITPYVAPPTSLPNPIAASISGRLIMELTVVTSVITAAAFSLGGMASVAVFTLTSALSVVIVHVLWPIASPLLRPFLFMAMRVGSGLWSVLMLLISGGGTGQKGIPALVLEGYRYVTSGALYSSARTLSAILFVFIAMAALAKFTLTRRPKDFTKWDIWQAIEFGYSKPQARVEGTTGVGFEDVAGIDDVVEELQELVSYLKNPERFNQMGTKPPHGVLLEGPPGCGKTLLAKAIAGEAGVPFYQMAGSEFVEVLVGVGAARIRDLFKRAKVNRPSVVFIDEIDALGAMRHGAAGEEGDESYNAGAQERETTLNQLLIELDGFDTGKGVVFLGATNRMDMLDPALLRPGRFDRKIAIRPPRAKGRLEILKVHAKSVKLSPTVDLWQYAKNLPGWTGAELAQLLQEAALVAVRHGGNTIMRTDMDIALDRLTMGPERLGLERRQSVHRRMATHEVGMAMASHILRRVESAEIEYCDRVSIIPRGETLSRTIFERLDDEAYLFNRRPSLIHRLKVMLAGRAAEELMYGRNTSTFSEQHLPDATWLARKLISIWNLEGPITAHGDPNPWDSDNGFSGPPLGFEGGLYDNYELVDKPLNYALCDDVATRTKNLVDRCYGEISSLLQQHVAAIAKAIYVVMEKEEILGVELDCILDQYPAGTPLQVVEEEDEPGEFQMPVLREELSGEETFLKSFQVLEDERHSLLVSSQVEARSFEAVESESSSDISTGESTSNGNGEHNHWAEEESSIDVDAANGMCRPKDDERDEYKRAEDLGRIDGDIAATGRKTNGEACTDGFSSSEQEHSVASSARTRHNDGD